MKKPLHFITILRFMLLLFVINSCGVATPFFPNVKKEYDDVKKSNRSIFTATYIPSDAWNQVLSFEKTFLIEVDSLRKRHITVSNNIKFTKDSEAMTQECYLVTDSLVFPLSIEFMDQNLVKGTTTEEKKIERIDSTHVKEITKINENFYHQVKMRYSLNDNMCEAILKSQKVKFRYYYGINMLTITIGDNKLMRLKLLFNPNVDIEKVKPTNHIWK